MANEIRLTYTVASGATVYCTIRKESDLTVWDANASQFVTWSDGSLSNYQVVLASKGGDIYAVDAPSQLPSGVYVLLFYERTGGSPSVDDIALQTTTWTYNKPGQTVVTNTTTVAGLDKLAAVNRVLIDNSIDRVLSLDTGGSSDAAAVEYLLDLVDEEIQAQGWYCNTDFNKELIKQTDGSIALPADALAIYPWTGANRRPNDDRSTGQHTRRGAKLYDLDNATETINANVRVLQVTKLPFNDLLVSLKVYIAAETSVRFQISRRSSFKADRFLVRQRDEARTMALKEDAELSNEDLTMTGGALEVLGITTGLRSRVR